MKAFRILRASVKQSAIYEMQYRTNFFINIFTNLGWAAISLLTVRIVGSNISVIVDNWSQYELDIVFCFFSISTFITSAFCRRNTEQIPQKIIRGDLDFLIVKPFNSKLLASFGYSRFDMIPSLIFLSYLSIHALLQVQNGYGLLINLSIMMLLLIFTVIIEYALLVMVMTLSFWLLGAYNLNYVFNQTNMFGSYPIHAFGDIFQFMFMTLFPIAFVATVPALVIINMNVVYIILIILVALITYKLSDVLWNVGLRGYSSASS